MCADVHPQRDPLLVAILGPTASGKTSLSLTMAEGFGGEILNCDSVAVYREFFIGTAKPSAEEQRRAPHHLLDIVDPPELFTAGEYARRARGVLGELKQRGRLPIVVGGTGFYLRALIDGLSEGPQRSDELRDRLRLSAERHSPGHLHRLLRRFDPAAAQKIHANDTSKLIRALEVCLAARMPMTKLWQQSQDPLRGFRVLRIGLTPNRDDLYLRINERAAAMFQEGLIEETSTLLAKYGDTARPLGSLGYKQAVEFLRGELTREAAIAAAQQGHRNYAKRQMTWFRREPDVHWLHGFGSEPEIVAKAMELVCREL